MSKNFRSVITKYGREKIAGSIVSGEKIVFAEMSVGDGNGGEITPDENQVSLLNEIYRTSLNSLKISDNSNNVIIAEMMMPPEVGGFTIREAALFDDAGVCMAVASVPETYKPLLGEGSGRFTVLRIWLIVSSTENIELRADPGIVIATIEDVIKVGNEGKDYTDSQISEHAKSRNHPDATLDEKGFTRLSNATDSDATDKAATPAAVKAAIASAIRSAWELENPVGTVRFYAQSVNPNEIYPWSQWVYTGENKTIRVGKADGSDVGKTGGSDNVTLQQTNLPAVQVNVSGETSELPGQELTTREAGRHKHKGGMLAPGEVWDDNYIVGSDNDSRRTRNYTDEVADHSHIVDLPAHKHTTSGKTANLGEGKSFSVVEAHTLLMCWSRVA
ncbi:phage tail protein [Klebsiella variicola]|uniref:phage tail protein n=1 Tax=Klebsiella variicola TaxID=244366 RepID=UPI00103309D8|nr:phage tail protein [Klebsiella variicola]